ncbi:MAG: NAD-dependent epimerase/dehydratase family protein [Caldimonas sp.]
MRLCLVTGAAGFIGAHVAARLARAGVRVVGCDEFNAYYDPRLKRDRVAALLAPLGVDCHAIDLSDAVATSDFLHRHGPFDTVVHLAAQAGVRHSIKAPMDYVRSNVAGFVAVLQACAETKVGHVVYASSSSVYGARTEAPFAEGDRTDAPASLYAATKQAGEAIAHSYASVHALPVTGLRFFTVYGPWGRPDMAYFSFARRMRRGETIPVFARGELLRDFTYIDDAVDAVQRLLERGPPRPADGVPAEIFNVGSHRPVRVLDFIASLERAVGRPAMIDFQPMQAGDVPLTCADPERLLAAIGPWAKTSLDQGLENFARWLDAWEPMETQR